MNDLPRPTTLLRRRGAAAWLPWIIVQATAARTTTEVVNETMFALLGSECK